MLTIEVSEYNTAPGAYAIVFIKNGRALKLFKSYNHPHLDGTGKEEISADRTNEYRKRVYQTEVDAYNLIKDSGLLKKFTPLFYGPISITKVIDNGKDISDQFLLDCCYEMEYIEGIAEKLNIIHGNSEILLPLEKNLGFSLHEIIKEFVKLGVHYTKDSSAVYGDKVFKIIDFATKDSEEFQPIIGVD